MKKCPISENRKNEFGVEKTRAVWAASRGRCSYCGVHLNKPDPAKEKDNLYLEKLFTMDHLKPTSKGGDNSIENLLASCRRCNNAKGNAHSDYLRYWLYRKQNPSAAKFSYSQFDFLMEMGINIGKMIKYKFFFERKK